MLPKRFLKSPTSTFSHRERLRHASFTRLARWLLIVILLFSVYLINQKIFLITDIRCLVSNGLCSASLSTTLSEYLGKSLLFLDRSRLKSSIGSSGQPTEIDISFQLPGRLIVKLAYPDFQVPVNLIQSVILPDEIKVSPSLKNLLDFSLLSQSITRVLFLNGQMIDGLGKSNITIFKATEESESIYSKYAQAVSLLTRSSINFTSIYFFDSTLVFSPDNSQSIIFSLDKPLEDQILALQQILSTVTIKESQIIDLRFNRPVIK